MRNSYCLRIVRRSVVASLSAGLFGCSIHPLPEDFSRATTFDIVERIRCEAQEGIRSFPPNDRDVQRIIAATTIGFDFNFVMTENNDATGGKLDFARPSFKNPSKGFTLGLSASATRLRMNTRKFRIVETLTELNQAKCSKTTTRPNWVYPIAGATGMSEVVRTYINLELLTSLNTVPSDSGTDDILPGKNVIFGDVLKFMTTLSAGATPTLTLSAVAGSLKLTNATITGSAQRSDTHDVIVALASDGTEDDGKKSSKFMRKFTRMGPGAREERKTFLVEDIVADSRSVTALVQKDARARNRVLIELQRLRNLEDDDREAPRLLGERFLEIMRQQP